MMDTPWSDCKVAFPIECDKPLWAAHDAGLLEFPQGWELCETDGTGERFVAVFRVKGVPTVQDGTKVLQALTGVISIKQIIERVCKLAAGAPEPKATYWLHHDEYGSSDADYCYECAVKVRAALIAGNPVDDDKHADHPNWKGCTQDTVQIEGGDYGHEAEGCRHCELCGSHLSVTLLHYGVKSELDHFESCGIDGPDDWRHFLDVLEGIDYVESAWWPGNRTNAVEVERSRTLYARAIKLAKRYLPQTQTTVQNLHE